MKLFVCQILVLSMLVLGFESSADMANDGHPIDPEGSHHSEVMHDSPADPDGDPEPDNENCEHCCHGHCAGIGTRAAANSIAFAASGHAPGRAPHYQNFAQAPPTPPPNA